MTPAQAIATQIKNHIEDCKANNEWYDEYELVKGYFNIFDIVDDKLFNQVLDLI